MLGISLFILMETMMFAGLISAFTIVRKSAVSGIWPPPGQPRLPIEETLINTIALLISGVLLFLAGRAFTKSSKAVKPLFISSVLLGLFFVVFQGVEWAHMLGQGLTLTSSTHGGFFYLIVGFHGMHAIGALIALTIGFVRLQKGALSATWFSAARVFWYFVVGLWPLLYWRVYL